MEADPVPMSAAKRRFRFIECLGRGGFGEVYRASMTDRGGVRTDVAVKVLHEEVDPASQAIRRLRDEAHVLAALRHPSILRVHDLVLLEGRVSLVTEFVDGQDLTGMIRTSASALQAGKTDARTPMPVRPLVDIVGQVASALAAAHDTPGETGEPLGLVHRDIKPHNIRIGRHGEVKLLDFGIARGQGIERSASTTDGSIVGSLQYMAPESFDGDQGPASDMFSLGCVLFEGLCGKRPWMGLEPRDLYALASRGGMRELLAERIGWIAEAPEAVRALAVRMLEHDPALRPGAAEVARTCEDLVDSLSGPTLRRWCAERAWPGPHRRRGEFDGREVVEGETTGKPLVPPPALEPGAVSDTLEHSGSKVRANTRAVAMAASGVAGLTVGGVVLVAALAVVLIGVGLSQLGSDRGSSVAPSPRPTAPARPSPPTPTPSPPTPDPTLTPTPAPVAGPAPQVPVSTPTPDPVPTGGPVRVVLDDKTKVPVRLSVGGEKVDLPASVRPGIWTVEAQFGGSWSRTVTTDVQGPGPRVVSCNSLLRSCTLR